LTIDCCSSAMLNSSDFCIEGKAPLAYSTGIPYAEFGKAAELELKVRQQHLSHVAAACSVNIRPVEAQRVALAAGQNGTINPFVIYVEDDLAAATRYCWLTMIDSQVKNFYIIVIICLPAVSSCLLNLTCMLLGATGACGAKAWATANQCRTKSDRLSGVHRYRWCLCCCVLLRGSVSKCSIPAVVTLRPENCCCCVLLVLRCRALCLTGCEWSSTPMPQATRSGPAGGWWATAQVRQATFPPSWP
jgi:hypothetical protein